MMRLGRTTWGNLPETNLSSRGAAQTSEVNPDQNHQSRDSGIPTKKNPGIPENREKFRDSRKSGKSRDSRKFGIFFELF